MKTIKEIYRAAKDGDPLTDEELTAGVEFFSDLASKLGAVGPEYYLAAKDARQIGNLLDDFRQSRIWHRKEFKKHGLIP